MSNTGSGSGTPIPASSSGVGIVRYVAPLKTPTAVLKYSFDWSDWLGDATIVTTAWGSDTGIAVASQGNVGAITTVSVSGGAERTAYRVTNTVTNSNGETDTRTVLIVVGPTTAGANGIQSDMLVYRLYSAMPPREGTAEDYEQLVKDAVNKLGEDVPLLCTATLSLVKGTASYALPDDFLFMIDLPTTQGTSGIAIGDGGLIPLAADYSETYTIQGNQVTFSPTPTYTTSRDYRYAATYALVNGAYPRLTQNGARVALLYAQHLALMEQATPAAGKGWKYQIGDEMVDKSNQGTKLRDQADGFLTRYTDEIKRLNNRAGSTARYAAGSYA